MLWLTGIVGMMTLGSVAIFSTSELSQQDENEDEGADDATVEPFEHQGEASTQNSILTAMDLIKGPVANDLPTDTPPPEVADVGDPGVDPVNDPQDTAEDAGVVYDAPSAGLIAEGGDGNDTMNGAAATDLLHGADGDDLVDGAGDDDQLHGGDGTDTLRGGSENDTMHGGGGDDRVFGDDGDDDLYGHDGDDHMDGGAGQDTLYGGLGDDAMQGGAGDDGLMGREGADTLNGGAGMDTLFGGWDDDAVIGILRDAEGVDIDSRDYLNGGDGDDTLTIGQDDIAHGGNGADSFVLGDWITGEAATLSDFDATEDQLLVVYDDSGLEQPELEFMADDDPDLTQIVLDGQVLAVMPTADLPAIESIVLMGKSSASALPGL